MADEAASADQLLYNEAGLVALHQRAHALILIWDEFVECSEEPSDAAAE